MSADEVKSQGVEAKKSAPQVGEVAKKGKLVEIKRIIIK